MSTILKRRVGKERVFRDPPHYAFHRGIASVLASLLAMLVLYSRLS